MNDLNLQIEKTRMAFLKMSRIHELIYRYVGAKRANRQHPAAMRKTDRFKILMK